MRSHSGETSGRSLRASQTQLSSIRMRYTGAHRKCRRENRAFGPVPNAWVILADGRNEPALAGAASKRRKMVNA